jgi:hypothetical protein
MKLPPAGKGVSTKQPALSLTQSREPNLQIKPEATRSLVVVVRPVQKETPAADAEGPTVGAKCRGIVTAYAIGWLKRVVPTMVYGGIRMRVWARETQRRT